MEKKTRRFKTYLVAFRVQQGQLWFTSIVAVSATSPEGARILARVKLERERHLVVGQHVSTERQRKKRATGGRPALAIYDPDGE